MKHGFFGRTGKFNGCEISHRGRFNRYLRWINPREDKRKRFRWKGAGFRFCMLTWVKIPFLTILYTPQTAHRSPNVSLNPKGIMDKVNRVSEPKRGRQQRPSCPFQAFRCDALLHTQFMKKQMNCVKILHTQFMKKQMNCVKSESRYFGVREDSFSWWGSWSTLEFFQVTISVGWRWKGEWRGNRFLKKYLTAIQSL